MIPALIHYVSLGDDVGRDDVIRWCTNSVRALHPAWQFNYVTEGVGIDLLSNHPTAKATGLPFKEFYDSIAADYKGRHKPKAIQSDLLKVLAVYVYGGFALDLDMYGVQPLDRFRSDDIVMGEIRDALVTEAIIGGHAGDPKLEYILRQYVERQRPSSNICFMELHARCVELGIKPYPPDYFVPHNRTDHGEKLYDHSPDTHTIHIWKGFDREYDRARIEWIGTKVRAAAASKGEGNGRS